MSPLVSPSPLSLILARFSGVGQCTINYSQRKRRSSLRKNPSSLGSKSANRWMIFTKEWTMRWASRKPSFPAVHEPNGSVTRLIAQVVGYQPVCSTASPRPDSVRSHSSVLRTNTLWVPFPTCGTYRGLLHSVERPTSFRVILFLSLQMQGRTGTHAKTATMSGSLEGRANMM